MGEEEWVNGKYVKSSLIKLKWNSNVQDSRNVAIATKVFNDYRTKNGPRSVGRIWNSNHSDINKFAKLCLDYAEKVHEDKEGEQSKLAFYKDMAQRYTDAGFLVH